MSLYVKSYLVENEKKRIFIVHGICEHSGRYQNLAETLNKEGFSVVTYDLRGHGRSEGKKAYIKNFHEHLKDLDDIIKENDNKAVKRYIIGHSLGGLIGHLYMLKNKQAIDGFIASGAPTDYLGSVKLLKITGYKWFGFINAKNNFGKDALSKDKKVEEKYNNDPLVLKKFKIRLAGEMFVKGVKHLKNNIKSNNKPILILHGNDDKIIPKEHSENIFNDINHNEKQLIIYKNMYHEIFNEIEKEKVFNDLIDWLNLN